MGYDDKLRENIEHYQELEKIVSDLGLQNHVIFKRNITNVERLSLLRKAKAVLYTPSMEHFGIVPVETMYLKTPVIAINNGGPMESVENNVTGYLID